MSTTQFYDDVIARLPVGTEEKVLRVLVNHVGRNNAIRLEVLATQAMGEATTTTTRQVREAIENLRRQGVPVMSESGRPGRWLAESSADVDICVSEMMARVNNLQLTIRALINVQVPFDEAGRQAPAVQARLF